MPLPVRNGFVNVDESEAHLGVYTELKNIALEPWQTATAVRERNTTKSLAHSHTHMLLVVPYVILLFYCLL